MSKPKRSFRKWLADTWEEVDGSPRLKFWLFIVMFCGFMYAFYWGLNYLLGPYI